MLAGRAYWRRGDGRGQCRLRYLLLFSLYASLQLESVLLLIFFGPRFLSCMPTRSSHFVKKFHGGNNWEKFLFQNYNRFLIYYQGVYELDDIKGRARTFLPLQQCCAKPCSAPVCSGVFCLGHVFACQLRLGTSRRCASDTISFANPTQVADHAVSPPPKTCFLALTANCVHHLLAYLVHIKRL